MSEECFKYAVENTDDKILAKAASLYGDACKNVEKEQEDLNRQLFSQVCALSVATYHQINCAFGMATSLLAIHFNHINKLYHLMIPFDLS